MPKHDLFSLHFSVLTMNNFVSIIILNITQFLYELYYIQLLIKSVFLI